MTRTSLYFALILGLTVATACRDEDALPSEPTRMDSGLQMPNRDASDDVDGGAEDAGDDHDASGSDAGQ